MSHRLPVEYVHLGVLPQATRADDASGETPRPDGSERERRIRSASETTCEGASDARREIRRLYQLDGNWWLAAGDDVVQTSVHGLPVGPSPHRVEPGTPIQTGDVLWTFSPANWVVIAHENVVVSAKCCLAVNYALHHCGMPVLGPVTVRNFGRRISSPMQLSLHLERFGDLCLLDIPVLEPLSRTTLAPPALGTRFSSLRRQLHPQGTELTVELNGNKLRKELVALGFWDWSHDESALKTIAAFVSPRNQVVERIAWDSQKDLRDATGIASFEELVKSARDDAEQLVLNAIYDTLAHRRNIQYLDPRLVETPAGTGTYQTVRPPQRVFAPDPCGPDGQATCLDLAILAAACLERASLCPLVIFAGNDAGVPTHAFLGCWLGSMPGSRAVVRDVDQLRRQVAGGNMLVVECTGVAQGVPGRAGTLTFDAAVAQGKRQMESYAWLAAVDVRAARPPFGSITPMESPLEPETAAAYDEAEQIVRRKRRKAIELTNLLYGLIATDGQITRWLFDRAGISLEQTREELDALIPSRHADEEPVSTWNYLECQRLAETYAWQSGVTSVREQDVLWAILNKRRDSKQLVSACARIGIDLDRLADILNGGFPNPQLPFRTSGSLRSSLD